jgi:hypothetical protein
VTKFQPAAKAGLIAMQQKKTTTAANFIFFLKVGIGLLTGIQ